jgi:protein-disulfide isomerase-like protein with CxxC motif
MSANILSILNQRHTSVPYAKIDESFTVNWPAMTDEIIAHLAWHGLKQLTGDTGAGLKKADEIREAAGKKMDALYAGKLRTVRTTDPTTKHARQAMFAHVQRAWAKDGKLLNKHYKAPELNAEVERRLADESDKVAQLFWKNAEAYVAALDEAEELDMPDLVPSV